MDLIEECLHGHGLGLGLLIMAIGIGVRIVMVMHCFVILWTFRNEINNCLLQVKSCVIVKMNMFFQ